MNDFDENKIMNKHTPKMVFIVPYRDRPLQLDFFKRHMKYVLEDLDKKDYKIFFIHQKDNRSFNRGAMKNIGFLLVKNLYPSEYGKITLIFNDLDTLPYVKNFLDYDTKPKVIKHFYGVKNTLGGIFSIKASDYEKINGFPNYWSWGYEDNLIYHRALRMNFTIDRSVFFPLMDGNIIHLQNGNNREVNRNEFSQYTNNSHEGWSSIHNLKYNIQEEMVNVTEFETGRREDMTGRFVHDLKKGNRPFSKRKPAMGLVML